jgi:hypothetical protein
MKANFSRTKQKISALLSAVIGGLMVSAVLTNNLAAIAPGRQTAGSINVTTTPTATVTYTPTTTVTPTITPTLTPPVSVTIIPTITLTMTPTITPTVTVTATPTITPTATAIPSCDPLITPPGNGQRQLLPFITTASAAPLPPPLPPPTPFTGTPPIDFHQVRADLKAQGFDLAFNKIGFHTGHKGNTTGLHDMLALLDEHCVPFFLKSVDNAQHLFFAQQLKQQSGLPHILVWRRTGLQFEVPNYDLPPAQAAQEHWQLHKNAFPPELDPSLIWIETVNEVDKERAEWLAEFSIEMAHLTMADGFNWAAFSWSSGTPEPEAWEGPKMLEFLALIGQHPNRLAIALHEYSFEIESISAGYPFLVGRFHHLFRAADNHHLPRPTILITEWGWTPKNVPPVAQAMEDIRWAAWLYAAYPQIKGAAIWYLGCCFGDIDDQTQQLIAPVADYSISNYFAIVPGFGQIDESIFLPNPPTVIGNP